MSHRYSNIKKANYKITANITLFIDEPPFDSIEEELKNCSCEIYGNGTYEAERAARSYFERQYYENNISIVFTKTESIN